MSKGLMTGFWQTLNLQLRRLLLCITRFCNQFACNMLPSFPVRSLRDKRSSKYWWDWRSGSRSGSPLGCFVFGDSRRVFCSSLITPTRARVQLIWQSAFSFNTSWPT